MKKYARLVSHVYNGHLLNVYFGPAQLSSCGGVLCLSGSGWFRCPGAHLRHAYIQGNFHFHIKQGHPIAQCLIGYLKGSGNPTWAFEVEVRGVRWLFRSGRLRNGMSTHIIGLPPARKVIFHFCHLIGCLL